RPRAVLVVAVDGGDGHLLGARRHTGATADAGAAARMDDPDSRLLEDLEVPLATRVRLHGLRAELDEEVDPVLDAAAGRERLLHHPRIEVQVDLLPRGAAPPVGDVDGNLAQLGD